MIGKRWTNETNISVALLVATILSIIIGAGMLCIGLTKETALTININAGLGLFLLFAAVVFSLFIAATGDEQAKGKSLAENDLVENEIYEVVDQLVSHEQDGKTVYRAFLMDRDGYVGAFRLSCSVPLRFKVVKDKDGNRRNESYPKPEPSEPQPAEQQ